MFARLDHRFANARPLSERNNWKAATSGVLSAVLTLGLLAFLYFQLKVQFKSLKFVEPAHGPPACSGQFQGSWNFDSLITASTCRGRDRLPSRPWLPSCAYSGSTW